MVANGECEIFLKFYLIITVFSNYKMMFFPWTQFFHLLIIIGKDIYFAKSEDVVHA
jgi:hypothetical protein